MAKRVQLIRHAATAADAFLGKIGEVTIDTTDKTARVHDGSTTGGFALARADLSNVASATASAAGKMTAAQTTLLNSALQSAGLGSVTQAFSAALLSIAGLTTSADKLIYATASNVYAVSALSAYARSLLDDADAATARATLGLGSVATLNNGSVDAATLGGTAASAYLNSNLIPASTKMVFYQAAAPSGWTQVTTQNDKALRVVSSSGGGAAGTHPLSSPPSLAHTHSGPSHTHGYTTVIAHTHGFTTTTNGAHTHTATGATNKLGTNGVDDFGNDAGVTTSSAGSHAHTGTTNSTGSGSGTTGASGTANTGSTTPTAFAPQYIDVIICSKD